MGPGWRARAVEAVSTGGRWSGALFVALVEA